MNLEELKKKTPAELISQAEKLEIENPSTLRKQEILFAILKKLAQKNEQITGGGVLEVLQDGFGFLRAIESNYLPGPDDIYVSPSQIRKFGLRTGDSVEGEIRGPKDQERYFALLKVDIINFDNPEKARNKIAFDRKFTIDWFFFKWAVNSFLFCNFSCFLLSLYLLETQNWILDESCWRKPISIKNYWHKANTSKTISTCSLWSLLRLGRSATVCIECKPFC